MFYSIVDDPEAVRANNSSHRGESRGMGPSPLSKACLRDHFDACYVHIEGFLGQGIVTMDLPLSLPRLVLIRGEVRPSGRDHGAHTKP